MEKFLTLYLEMIIKKKYRLVLTGNYADIYSFCMDLFYSLCTVMYMQDQHSIVMHPQSFRVLFWRCVGPDAGSSAVATTTD